MNATTNTEPKQIALAAELLPLLSKCPEWADATERDATRAELVAAVDAGDYDRLADALIQAQLELRTICCECLGPIPGEFSDEAKYCSRNCYEAGGQ